MTRSWGYRPNFISQPPPAGTTRVHARGKGSAQRHASGFGWGAIALTAIISATLNSHFARDQSPPRVTAPQTQAVAPLEPAQAVLVSLQQPATDAPAQALQGLAALPVGWDKVR